MAEIILSLNTDIRDFTADAVIVWCSDYRFSPALKKLIQTLNLKRVDRILVTGGAKSIPEKNRSTLEDVKGVVRQHKAKRIILTTHSDCDACGGLKRWSGNREKEFAFHKKTLAQAQERVEKMLKRMGHKAKIETLFVGFENIIRV